MNQKLGHREFRQISEAQALIYHEHQPRTRDGYLSLSVPLSKTNYGFLWHSRGDILPLLQLRHQQMLVLKGRSEQDYQDLIDVRRKLTRLQREFPKDDKDLKERDDAVS